MKKILFVALGVIVGSALTASIYYFFLIPKTQNPIHRMPFQTNIVKATADNTDYRNVLFTGAKSQLVVMSIPPGGEVGQETHKHVEQILYFQSGTGEAILDGKTTQVGPGDVVIVTPGTQHNFINTGTVPLQITTTYAPPNHIDGTIERTKAEADANTADEAFGNAQ
jgi:mannose-6-phosphate isomerase-like protein (cupin superfamily)